MPENDSTLMAQKSCVVQASRRERDISLRVYYDVRDEDGCKVYTLAQVIELKS